MPDIVLPPEFVTAHPGPAKIVFPSTEVISPHLDIPARLQSYHYAWDRWKVANQELMTILVTLDPNIAYDRQFAQTIEIQRQRLEMKLQSCPIEVNAAAIDAAGGYMALRDPVRAQCAALTKQEKIDWLLTFRCIITPELSEFFTKVGTLVGYSQDGPSLLSQGRNLLLGGLTGTGKTTAMNLLAALNERVQKVLLLDVRGIPREYSFFLQSVLSIESPVLTSTSKPLWQRMLVELNWRYSSKTSEEELQQILCTLFTVSGVSLLMLDEVSHIQAHRYRRKVLSFSNRKPKLPIICSSCEPEKWTAGDAELAGRWNDSFTFQPYRGERLSQLLTYFELLSPLPQDSGLALFEVRGKSGLVRGPAAYVEEWTHGTMKNITILIAGAMIMAIEQNSPRITVELLQRAWESIQAKPNQTFLDLLQSWR